MTNIETNLADNNMWATITMSRIKIRTLFCLCLTTVIIFLICLTSHDCCRNCKLFVIGGLEKARKETSQLTGMSEVGC